LQLRNEIYYVRVKCTPIKAASNKDIKKDFNKIMNKEIKEKIRKFYIKLDKGLNMENQAIGWTAVFFTFIIIGLIIKFFSNNPDNIIAIIKYIDFRN